MSKFYDDIPKDVKDTLDKGFLSGGAFKVSVDTRTADGVSVTSTVVHVVREKDGKQTVDVAAAIEPKFDWKAHDMELNTRLSGSGNYEGELVLKNFFGAAGTKLAVKAVEEGPKSVKALGSVTYQNDKVAVKTSVTYPFSLSKPISFGLNSALIYNNFYVGGIVNYDTAFEKEEGVLKEPSVSYGASVGYNSNKGYSGFATLRNYPLVDIRDYELSLGWFNKIDAHLKYAVSVAADQSGRRGVTSIIGAEYRFDDFTTVKGKMTVNTVKPEKLDKYEQDYRAGLAITQRINSHVIASVGADVNILKVLGANSKGPSTTFGFELKFS